MPYIKNDLREDLDPSIDGLINHVRALPTDEQDGALNYVIFRLLLGIYEPRYFNYNRAMGVLGSVTQEFYRRKIGPY